MRPVVTVALVMAVAAGSTSAHVSLPLRHGRYVDATAECRGSPSSARSWFGGGALPQSPHAHCDEIRSARIGADRYRVVAKCFENGDRSLSFTLVDRIRVIDHTHYELSNRYGRFHAHWCRD